jgi:hypothetical protein
LRDVVNEGVTAIEIYCSQVRDSTAASRVITVRRLITAERIAAQIQLCVRINQHSAAVLIITGSKQTVTICDVQVIDGGVGPGKDLEEARLIIAAYRDVRPGAIDSQASGVILP